MAYTLHVGEDKMCETVKVNTKRNRACNHNIAWPSMMFCECWKSLFETNAKHLVLGKTSTVSQQPMF